jgi:hypothetical protein
MKRRRHIVVILLLAIALSACDNSAAGKHDGAISDAGGTDGYLHDGAQESAAKDGRAAEAGADGLPAAGYSDFTIPPP